MWLVARTQAPAERSIDAGAASWRPTSRSLRDSALAACPKGGVPAGRRSSSSEAGRRVGHGVGGADTWARGRGPDPASVRHPMTGGTAGRAARAAPATVGHPSRWDTWARGAGGSGVGGRPVAGDGQPSRSRRPGLRSSQVRRSAEPPRVRQADRPSRGGAPRRPVPRIAASASLMPRASSSSSREPGSGSGRAVRREPGEGPAPWSAAAPATPSAGRGTAPRSRPSRAARSARRSAAR